MKMNITSEGILFSELFLDLERTLFCGQCFGWKKEGDIYTGTIGQRAYRLRQLKDGVFLLGGQEGDIPVVVNYFDMETDYSTLLAPCMKDRTFEAAYNYAPGIRVLRQPFFEVLMNFIVSQLNNIKRIEGITQRLRENFGEPISEGLYSFPTPQRISQCEPEDLGVLRAGFRAKYLVDGARKVESGEVDETFLREAPLPEARKMLMKINGVGEKVADCILLYGCGRIESFPVDVWMQRVLDAYYPKGLPRSFSGVEGLCQQYLFHFARTSDEAKYELKTGKKG